MPIGARPLGEWLAEAGVENAEEIEEIMSDLLGDNLTLKELSPGRLDDDALLEVCVCDSVCARVCAPDCVRA